MTVLVGAGAHACPTTSRESHHPPALPFQTAPAVALASNGLINQGAPSTCYPAPKFREKLSNAVDSKVVVTGNLITSQGPGTALDFALQLGEALYGKEKRDAIAKEMLVT